MELPGVGSQVEGVVLGAFAEPAMPGREQPLQDDRLVSGERRTDDVTADGDVGVRRSGDVASVHLVRDDRRLVDDDVHEPEDVGARLEVEEDGGVAVDDGTFGQDVDGQRVGHGDDLRRHIDGDVDDALLHLRRDRKVDFDFVVGADKDLVVKEILRGSSIQVIASPLKKLVRTFFFLFHRNPLFNLDIFSTTVLDSRNAKSIVES